MNFNKPFNSLKHYIPMHLVKLLLPIAMLSRARRNDLILRKGHGYWDVISGSRTIRLSLTHAIYIRDIIDSFDYYFNAVIPFRQDDIDLVDYSTPRYHDIPGFNTGPIMFPSLAEPLITTTQYMEFANLREGLVVLDLGAYSGLTSIIFAQAVGETGAVVAVDADPLNIECIKRNLSHYYQHNSGRIHVLAGAVWNHDLGIKFSCEGNMGSSAVGIVGNNRGATRNVPSFTLSNIARKFELERVDFIKCDVEGAEIVIFDDKEFFQRFSPNIIIEAHIIDGEETTSRCIEQLEKWGYQCEKIFQHGVQLPLLECRPPASPDT